MTDADNLSWGRLTACSLDGAKFWLRYIAQIWFNATHGAEEVEEIYRATIATVMEDQTYSDSSDNGVKKLFENFSALAGALVSLDHNPVRVKTEMLDDAGSPKLRLRWDGAWTTGRYFSVSYEPENWPTVFVEWNTGTGEESTFLSLPSEAKKFVEDNAGVEYSPKLRPVVNHYREAAKKLGVDVSDIPEQGDEGVRKAKRALDNLIKKAVEQAEQDVRKSGAVTA